MRGGRAWRVRTEAKVWPALPVLLRLATPAPSPLGRSSLDNAEFLRRSAEEATDAAQADWGGALAVGRCLTATVDKVVDYGVLVDLPDHPVSADACMMFV